MALRNAVEKIRLPANGWRPREYQLPLWGYIEHGGKRAVTCWHRRSGKDAVYLNRTACASQEEIGNYVYLMPEAKQARKALWNGVNPATSKNRIDEAFPEKLRARTQDNEMFIELRNGSTFQLAGSDNYNSLVGSSFRGIVFSEYSLSNPLAWSYLRPILAENNGWALFNGTPRGRNHFHKLLELARNEPGWFHQVLTVDDTGVMSKERLESELRELISEYGAEYAAAFFRQEYHCSFDVPIMGSYYGHLIEAAERAGRVRKFQVEPGHPIHTGWDLGVDDPTSIWFAQIISGEVRIVDYLEAMGKGADYYAAQLRAEHRTDWVYGHHFAPHDVKNREWGAVGAKTRIETLKSYGVIVTPIPVTTNLADDIDVVRLVLRRTWFNSGSEMVADGMEKLRQYRAAYDREKKVLSKTPVHDFTSHAADGFRTLAIGLSAHMIDGKSLAHPQLSGVARAAAQSPMARQARGVTHGGSPYGFRK